MSRTSRDRWISIVLVAAAATGCAAWPSVSDRPTGILTITTDVGVQGESTVEVFVLGIPLRGNRAAAEPARASEAAGPTAAARH